MTTFYSKISSGNNPDILLLFYNNHCYKTVTKNSCFGIFLIITTIFLYYFIVKQQNKPKFQTSTCFAAYLR